MRNIAGGEAALDLHITEVFDAAARIAIGPMACVTACVGQSFPPRVMHVVQQSTGRPLSQRCLPGIEIRLLGIVDIADLDIVRVGTQSRNAVNLISRPGHVELHSARPDECAPQHERRCQGALKSQSEIHRMGGLRLRIIARSGCQLRPGPGFGCNRVRDVAAVERPLQAEGGGLRPGKRAGARNKGSCYLRFVRWQIEALEIDTETASHDEVTPAVGGVSETESGPDAEVVVLKRLQWITRWAPCEVHRIDQSIHVEQASGLTVVAGITDVMTIAVVARSQVEDQLPVYSPVVLQEEPEVDHP